MDIANEYGCKFMETSAKTGKNVNEVFDYLLNNLINEYGIIED